jgi:hypothetical protein
MKIETIKGLIIAILALAAILFAGCIESSGPTDYIEIELESDDMEIMVDVPTGENATGLASLRIVNETTNVVVSDVIIEYEMFTYRSSTGELLYREIYIFQENGSYLYNIWCSSSGSAWMRSTNVTDPSLGVFGNWSIVSEKSLI